MTALALPEPHALTAAQWADEARQAREELAERRDIDGACELRDRLAAVRGYLARKAADKSAVLGLEAEERRVEVLIGELLGEAEVGANQHSDRGSKLEPLGIPKVERNRFRALAAHADTVERLISEGVTKRKPILDRIKEQEQADQPAPGVRKSNEQSRLLASIWQQADNILMVKERLDLEVIKSLPQEEKDQCRQSLSEARTVITRILGAL